MKGTPVENYFLKFVIIRSKLLRQNRVNDLQEFKSQQTGLNSCQFVKEEERRERKAGERVNY